MPTDEAKRARNDEEPSALAGLAPPAGLDPACWARLCAVAERACEGRNPAHDALHVARVTRLAQRIARDEPGVDARVAGLAALLHELVNLPKHHPEAARSGERCALEAARVLRDEGLEGALVDAVRSAIEDHAFSKGVAPAALEARVLQDADRLDAIGALGVARCMATCAEMGRPFYHPDDPFGAGRAHDDKRWGVDHFYRKLLKLPGQMHTATGRALAVERGRFTELFLAQLARELEPSSDAAEDRLSSNERSAEAAG